MTKTELIDAIAAGVDGLTKARRRTGTQRNPHRDHGCRGQGRHPEPDRLWHLQPGERGERMARNPRTGEEIKVEAAKTVKFKAGQKFKDAVNQ